VADAYLGQSVTKAPAPKPPMLVTPTIAAQVEAVVGMGDHGLLPSTVKPNPIQHCACAYAQTRAKTAQRRVPFIL